MPGSLQNTALQCGHRGRETGWVYLLSLKLSFTTYISNSCMSFISAQVSTLTERPRDGGPDGVVVTMPHNLPKVQTGLSPSIIAGWVLIKATNDCLDS